MHAATLNEALRRCPPGALYALGLLPAAGLWYLGFTGGLGPEPINALERELGLIGLQFLIASLAVSPLRRFVGLNFLRFRRALGLLSFFYILQHLLVWLVLDIGEIGRIWTEIVKRPYVTLGMVGFAAMLPLAVTSNDWSVRRLGAAAWRRLHRLAYLAALAGAAHYVVLVKGWPLEPILYATAVVALLAIRLVPARRASSRGT